MKRRPIRGCLVALLCSTMMARAIEAKELDIPAGEMRVALETLAKQTGAELIYQVDQVSGLRTKGVTGNPFYTRTADNPAPQAPLPQSVAFSWAKAQLSQYTIRRYGKPDDVAAMTVFLCSGAASWITGQTYPVNGGYSFAV